MTIFTETRTRQSFLEEFQAPLADVLGVTAEESLLFSPLSSIMRQRELSRARRGVGPTILDTPIFGEAAPSTASEMVNAEAARQKIVDEGVELTVPDTGIRQRALEILIERKKEERRRQDVLSRAPGGFGPGAARVATALGTSVLDPLNVASAFVPVVGQARYAAMLGRAGGAFGRAGVRAGVGAVEGTAGAALVEPLIYGVAASEQADYDLTDSLLNIGFGTALGGGLHVGAGAAGDAIARGLNWRQARAVDPLPRMLEATDFAVREQALRTGVAQAASGRAIDVEAIVTYANTNTRFQEPLRAAVGQDFADAPRVDAAVAEAGPGLEARSVSDVTMFTTARGSVYEARPDGTTVRNKAARADPGHEGQFGTQPRTDKTVYASPADVQRLGTPQGEWRVIDHGNGTLSIATKAADGGWGIAPSQRNVPVSETPAVGAIPIELWRPETVNNSPAFKSIHFGNEITSVQPSSRAGVRAAAPQPIDLRARATASFAPEAIRLYDGEAIRLADEKIAQAPSDEGMPEATLESALEDINALVAALDATERAAKRTPIKAGRVADPEKAMPRKPVQDMLRDAGGVKPDSPLGAELMAMGLTKQNTRGLFKMTGRGAADNFVASEHPIFAGREDDGNGYIPEDIILEALRDEIFGVPWRSPDQIAEIERYRSIVDRREGIVREEGPIAEAPPVQSEAEYGTFEAMVARELAEFEELAETAEAYGRAVSAAAFCQLRRGA